MAALPVVCAADDGGHLNYVYADERLKVLGEDFPQVADELHSTWKQIIGENKLPPARYQQLVDKCYRLRSSPQVIETLKNYYDSFASTGDLEDYVRVGELADASQAICAAPNVGVLNGSYWNSRREDVEEWLDGLLVGSYPAQSPLPDEDKDYLRSVAFDRIDNNILTAEQFASLRTQCELEEIQVDFESVLPPITGGPAGEQKVTTDVATQYGTITGGPAGEQKITTDVATQYGTIRGRRAGEQRRSRRTPARERTPRRAPARERGSSAERRGSTQDRYQERGMVNNNNNNNNNNNGGVLAKAQADLQKTPTWVKTFSFAGLLLIGYEAWRIFDERRDPKKKKKKRKRR